MATDSKSRTPLKAPIIVSEYGEAISGYPDSEFEESTLDTVAGVHYGGAGGCRGFVDARRVSESHKALYCRGCHLRIVIPVAVNTLGDLRKHFAKYNK